MNGKPHSGSAIYRSTSGRIARQPVEGGPRRLEARLNSPNIIFCRSFAPLLAEPQTLETRDQRPALAIAGGAPLEPDRMQPASASGMFWRRIAGP